MARIPITSKEGPNIEPGTYKAICTEVKDDMLENPQFGDGSIVRLYMRLADVLDDEGERITLDAIANAKVSPKSKLTRWAEALGQVINFEHEGEYAEFDTDVLVGCSALVKITRKDSNSWPRIEDMVPLPKTRELGMPSTGKKGNSQSPLERLQALFLEAVEEIGEAAAIDCLGEPLSFFIAYTADGGVSLNFDQEKPGVPDTVKAINAFKAALGK